MRNMMINTEARFNQFSIILIFPSTAQRRKDFFQAGVWPLFDGASTFIDFFYLFLELKKTHCVKGDA
jgi:hypothetical protein